MNATMVEIGNTERALWVPLLQLAAREVFERMLGTTLLSSPDPYTTQPLEVTSMVGLAGLLRGVISVRCTPESARLMAAKMLGLAPKEVGEEMWDAVGEICNMVAGNFKNKVSGLGNGCMLSVPTVITGADYSLHPLTDSGRIETQLLFEGSPLVITIEVHS
jgi:chemotaxis protein CheX